MDVRTRPCLFVLVPGDWDAVPEGLAELRRYLSDEFGPSLRVHPTVACLPAPVAVRAGRWDESDWRYGHQDIEQVLVPNAFFSLDWLEEVL